MRGHLWQYLLAAFLISAPVFQNCSSSKVVNGSNQEATSNSLGGVPYDGKLYVMRGEICVDGSTIRSAIKLKSGRAELVRDNCTNLSPMEIPSQDLVIVSETQITYKSQSYAYEPSLLKLAPASSWDYQLVTPLKSRSVQILDIDMFDNSTSTIAALKAEGKVAICYISVGSWEDYRPDAGLFDSADIGNVLGGGSPDRWLNIRSGKVRQLMLARLDMAKTKGCDGVDLDNVDAFSSNSGFSITASSQIEYNRYLANAAHDRGLIVALNNVGDLVPDLVHDFDFVVAQQCYQSGECDKYNPFLAAGKAVLNVEYTGYSQTQCNQALSSGVSLVFLSRQLDGSTYRSCD